MEKEKLSKGILALWFLLVINGVGAGYYGIVCLDSSGAFFLTTLLTLLLGVIAAKMRAYGVMWLVRKDVLYTSENFEKVLYASSTAFISYLLMMVVVWAYYAG